MLPNAEGRFCNSCAKTVVDFTQMTDKEVQQYFIQHHNSAVCGRFKNNQVQRIVIDLPKNIFNIQMPVWMRFLIACLLIFGISIFPFETTVAGKSNTEMFFYQGEPIIRKEVKKPRFIKKKKLRYKKTRLEDIDITALLELSSVTMGYTAQEQSPPIFTKSIFELPGEATVCSTEILPKENLAENTPRPEKKYPGPTPYVPAEFILPSILIYKRRK
jgi:hypothetical protein